MSKVDVVLVNATGDDIRVGAGPTLIEVGIIALGTLMRMFGRGG